MNAVNCACSDSSRGGKLQPLPDWQNGHLRLRNPASGTSIDAPAIIAQRPDQCRLPVSYAHYPHVFYFSKASKQETRTSTKGFCTIATQKSTFESQKPRFVGG